jgi:hypothetical protein
VEGSEEHFDESEHVGDLAEEERSTDGEDGFGEEVDETRENERQGCRSSEGSDFESENEGEGCRGPEGSDFAAEESCEEGGPDTEEGYEDVWDEVQETLSRWSMKSLTRLPRPSKVSSVATLFGIIPSVSAVLGYV